MAIDNLESIEVVTADTKTDRAEGAKAGLEVIDKGADLVIVSCDYDFGSPAALGAIPKLREAMKDPLIEPVARKSLEKLGVKEPRGRR